MAGDDEGRASATVSGNRDVETLEDVVRCVSAECDVLDSAKLAPAFSTGLFYMFQIVNLVKHQNIRNKPLTQVNKLHPTLKENPPERNIFFRWLLNQFWQNLENW